MKQLKISAGIWFLGATSDRFVKQGYRPDKTIAERFKLAAAVEGVGPDFLYFLITGVEAVGELARTGAVAGGGDGGCLLHVRALRETP